MIACSTCGSTNPLGTRFCRTCGAKLDVQVAQIVGSIAQTKQDNRDDALFRAGMSALSLLCFILICAMGARWLLVPAMPRADVPDVPIGPLLPDAITAPAAVAPVQSSNRLQWRHDAAPTLITALGVDVADLRAMQKTLMAVQKEDGSFPGLDPIATTGLMTFALQAFPCDDDSIRSAAHGRQWLRTQLPSISRGQPLARTLMLAALSDANELALGEAGSLTTYLTDAKAPLWQALALATVDVQVRPHGLTLLRAAEVQPWWVWYFDLLDGRPSTAAITVLDDPAKLTTGEERWRWAFMAWHLPASPALMKSTMSGWSKSPPAPVMAETTRCGALAPTALALLSVTAAARVPPIWPAVP